MKIDKNQYESNIKNLTKLVNILDDFFEKKHYNKKHFLENLKSKINNDIKLNLNNKRLSNLLISYQKFHYQFNKLHSLRSKFDNELCLTCNQKGGFFFNKYDNKYMKTLTIIDFLFDIINLIPNQIISSNYNFITMPYAISSLLINLFRGDYDFIPFLG